MFFVSLSSFRRLGHFLLLAIGLGLNATSCLAQSPFLTVASTPYDRQMIPISRTLNAPAGRKSGRTSLATINRWMIPLRAIPYQYSWKWKTPAQARADFATDCKGKATILYAEMRANGASHVRFVIGKHRITDLRTHAWLEWDTTSGTYLLDPTFNSTAERVSDRDPATYIPHYAYNGARKYRASCYPLSGAPVVASN